MDPEKAECAVKMFELICAYMGIRQEGLERPELIELAANWIKIGRAYSELRNEIFMQLIKQSRDLPYELQRQRIWELWLIAATVFEPEKVTVNEFHLANAFLGICGIDFRVHPSRYAGSQGISRNQRNCRTRLDDH